MTTKVEVSEKANFCPWGIGLVLKSLGDRPNLIQIQISDSLLNESVIVFA